MELVVDTNILFSFFWNQSLVGKALRSPSLYLIAPTFAIRELNRNKKDIIRKTKLTSSQFEKALEELPTHIFFVEEREYSDTISMAASICPDPDDIDFIALALRLKLELWSDDKDLKNQSKVTVYSTEQLIEVIKVAVR